MVPTLAAQYDSNLEAVGAILAGKGALAGTLDHSLMAQGARTLSLLGPGPSTSRPSIWRSQLDSAPTTPLNSSGRKEGDFLERRGQGGDSE